MTCIKIEAILIFVLFTTGLAAQSTSTAMGARAQGLANSGACLKDEFAYFNNIAGLAYIQEPSLTFSYLVNPSLEGANKTCFSIALPTKIGVAGIGAFRFGDDLYSEQIISAGFSNQLGLASIGVKANLIQYNTEGFGTKNVFSLNFGGIATLSPTVTVGVYIININQPTVSRVDDELSPTLLVAGAGFTPSEKVYLTLEVEKDIDYDATWKAGFEYIPIKKLAFRTGFSLHPNVTFFGVGFNPKRFKVDYSIQHHIAFNLSHQASISYQINKK